MRRRNFIGLVFGAFALSPGVRAQRKTGKVNRVGYLSLGTAVPVLLDAFSQALHELGWVQGQNIEIYYQYAEGQYDRWKRRRENPSLTEAAGSSGCAGVKLRQQMAFARSRQGSGDEGRGALWAGSLWGSD